MKKIFTLIVVFFLLAGANIVSAYQPRAIYQQLGNIQISEPEISQQFFDNLNGKPRDYFIDSGKDFELHVNVLVPEAVNRDGKYSIDVFDGQDRKIYFGDALSFDWQEYYDSFGRDYYLKGPEFSKQVPAGKYKIEVYSKDNRGKYVLAVGKEESYDIQSVLNIYWQLPLLKITFFKTSLLQFFLTPFGIAGVAALFAVLIFLVIINYFVRLIIGFIKHHRAKTLLLTSNGMQMKEEIKKLLQKPAYDITVAFIATAYKYKVEENPDYANKDLQIMRDEMGFNVEEIDIEGKKEHEVMKLLELKDIIFVAGGNTFYLLKAMRGCHFEKVIRKLLKYGKVYIGASAGSIVAGRSIKTAGWKEADKNVVGLRNLKGLNLVPFDIFLHFLPEHAGIIKKKMPWKWQRRKLKILTDDQAILVQGREVDLIGKGEKIIV